MNISLNTIISAISAVEALKHLFEKGSDKQAAARDIVLAAIGLSPDRVQNASPQILDALNAAIDAQVAAMKAKDKVQALVAALK